MILQSPENATIVQGANNPFIIQFDMSVAACEKLVVSIWSRGKLIKAWTMDEMTVEDDTVVCPITEEETAAIKARPVTLEAKGQDEYGNTVFWEAIILNVKQRLDKVIQ